MLRNICQCGLTWNTSYTPCMRTICVCVVTETYLWWVQRTINTTHGLYSVILVGYKIALVGIHTMWEYGGTPTNQWMSGLGGGGEGVCVCVCVCACNCRLPGTMFDVFNPPTGDIRKVGMSPVVNTIANQLLKSRILDRFDIFNAYFLKEPAGTSSPVCVVLCPKWSPVSGLKITILSVKQ